MASSISPGAPPADCVPPPPTPFGQVLKLQHWPAAPTVPPPGPPSSLTLPVPSDVPPPPPAVSTSPATLVLAIPAPTRSADRPPPEAPQYQSFAVSPVGSPAEGPPPP